MKNIPNFPFDPPVGYRWIIERGLAGFEPFSSLQPWYLATDAESFSPSEKWPQGPCNGKLFVFAKRQDNDDLACFRQSANGIDVVTIHGWTDDSYQVTGTFPTIWDWLKSAIDEIAQWAAQ